MIARFWDDGSVFRRLFDACDPSRALEIASGHGRHVEQLLARHPASFVVALDINQENVEVVRRRFAGDDRVSAVLGNGYDLACLPADHFTLVFSYDAMVHFDDEVVFSYCRELARVLAPGGRALIHHSNWTGTPGGSYTTNPHWRNFMSYRWLAHRAVKAGLRVVTQVVIPWGTFVDLDAVSLLEKPA